MVTEATSKQSFSSFFVHICAFFLLSEWIWPITAITEMISLHEFVLFIALCFVLSFLRARFFISAPIKLMAMIYFVYSLYSDGYMESPSWMTGFIADISASIPLLFQANLQNASPVFRTFLLFVVLWLVCYIVYYWIIVPKRLFSLLTVTIVCVTFLDTFTPYNGTKAIIRIVAAGMFMLAILHIERMKVKEQLQTYRSFSFKLFIPLISIMMLSVTVGYFAPKAAPQWPDPVPYLGLEGLQGKGSGTGGKGISTVGYDEDDSKLGGPFIQDNTVVFTATVQNDHYWRVETKNVYTGKGWDVSANKQPYSFDGDNTAITWYEDQVETELTEASVTMKETYPHIVYPAGLISIAAGRRTWYSTDTALEKIVSWNGSSTISLNQYKLYYEFPSFSVQDLQTVQEGTGLEANALFLETYTQLPNTLPERVRQLAADITKNQTNRYDKALAIENYFSSNSYVYDRVNVSVPNDNEDYVDQFLFETKRGYCNNFSTSMIVMLRSIGIPARWVKGYTEGTYVETTNVETKERVYEVTNNDAHSWVEVYFPGYGWVPFEPTKGFNNPYSFVNNVPEDSTQAAAPVTPDSTETAGQNETEMPEDTTERTEAAPAQPILSASNAQGTILFYIIGIIACFVLFITRRKAYAWLSIFLYEHRSGDTVFPKAYNTLLKQLARSGFVRSDGQTLREYAASVDAFYNCTDMQTLTANYEKMLYRNNHRSDWEEFAPLWKNMMKKTAARRPKESSVTN